MKSGSGILPFVSFTCQKLCPYHENTGQERGKKHGGQRSLEHRDFTAPETQVCVNRHETHILYGNQSSCRNCHALQAPHAVKYLDHDATVPASGAYTTRCSSCRSMNLPIAASAPVGTVCHTVGSPYRYTGCTSCHSRSPTTRMYRTHAGEAARADCHQGAGSGNGLNHFYDGAVDMVFPVPDFTCPGERCSGSCHGRNHSNFSW